jgi:hypothetical protein
LDKMQLEKKTLCLVLHVMQETQWKTDWFQVQFLWAFFVLIFDHVMLFASINKGMSFRSMSAKLRWLTAQLEAACWCKCEEIGEWWMESNHGWCFFYLWISTWGHWNTSTDGKLYKHPVMIVAKGT